MLATYQTKPVRKPLAEDSLRGIRKNLASAMVGSTVDLLSDRHTIAHGIVTGVYMASGAPKIVVNGRTYDMSQVLRKDRKRHCWDLTLLRRRRRKLRTSQVGLVLLEALSTPALPS